MSIEPQLHAYIKDKIKGTQFFKTDINESFIVACFGTESYGELTKYIFKHYLADVAILVELRTKTVNVTIKEGSTFNIKSFIEKVCDGKADLNKAQGIITEKFTQFTKKLVPC